MLIGGVIGVAAGAAIGGVIGYLNVCTGGG